jgi:hypothetical protein
MAGHDPAICLRFHLAAQRSRRCRADRSSSTISATLGDVSIRKCGRKNGPLVNTVIKHYPNCNQFWNYDSRPSWLIRSIPATPTTPSFGTAGLAPIAAVPGFGRGAAMGQSH